MKKVFGVILSLIMVFSLFSCVEKEIPDDPIVPTIESTKVCILQENSRLYAYDVEDGTKELIYDKPVNGFLVKGDIVYLTSTSWDILSVDMNTKEVNTYLQSNDEYIVLDTVLDSGIVYTDSTMEAGSTTYYLDFKTKEIKALVPNIYGNFNAFYGDNLICIYWGDGKEIIRSMNILTGLVNWEHDMNEYLGIINTYEGRFFYKAYGGKYVEVDLATGNETDVLDMSSIGYRINMEDSPYDYMFVSKDEVVKRVFDSSYSPSLVIDAKNGIMTVENLGETLIRTCIYKNYLTFESKTYFYKEDSGEYDFTLTYNYVFNRKSGEFITIDQSGKYNDMFKDGDFPIMDSSTARKGVCEDIYSRFTLEAGVNGNPPICSTTHLAWLGLADGISDICLLAAPTDEEQEYLKSKNVEVEMKLYGGDALVFIVGKDCGVKDLTIEQIKAIYSGKITNWSEVGGIDHEIHVLFRDDQSGSQRLFESMLFPDEIPDYYALGFTYFDTMASIVQNVVYEEYAIGYTIMTYLGDFFENADVTCLSVDGVKPVVNNVANGTYPLATRGYVVIRKDEEENSPARRLYNLFGTEYIDEILSMNSVSPLHE